MPIEVLMPALSPTMTEGKIAKWLKKEGDQVKAGDVLAEIETDKATMEIEAVDEGTLARIVVPEGTEHVAVNLPIAVIAGEGESVDEAARAAPAAAPAPSTPAQEAPVEQVAKAEPPRRGGHQHHADPGEGAIGQDRRRGLQAAISSSTAENLPLREEDAPVIHRLVPARLGRQGLQARQVFCGQTVDDQRLGHVQ